MVVRDRRQRVRHVLDVSTRAGAAEPALHRRQPGAGVLRRRHLHLGEGGGALAGPTVTDAFVDPTNGRRVLAIGLTAGIYSVYESTDGGATFGPPLYTAPAGYAISGVESAQSDPQTIYLAMTSPEMVLLLARSGDGGGHFAQRDLGPSLGRGQLRIVAVDPDDRDRVLLRLLGADDQALALTTDGGASATRPVVITGNFTSFVRLPSGTLLVGAMADGAVVPALFRSHDCGGSFERLAASPSVRALSQRAGVVYAATDNFGDGYALGASTDEGNTVGSRCSVTKRCGRSSPASRAPVRRFARARSTLACGRKRSAPPPRPPRPAPAASPARRAVPAAPPPLRAAAVAASRPRSARARAPASNT